MALEKLKKKWNELDIYDKVTIICEGLLTGTCMVAIPIGVRRSNKAYEKYLQDALEQNATYQLKQLEVMIDTLNKK